MTVEEKIREFLRENFLFGSHEAIADSDSLLDRGIIDSTGAMELVSFLEESFGVRVDDEDLVPENLDSVAAISSFVARKLAQPQPRSSAISVSG